MWAGCLKSEHEVNMSKEHLSTYLNDHLAGSVAALEILDHLIQEANDLSPFFTKLKADIEVDRQELVGLMNRLHISQSRIRKAGVWLVEQIAEAKFGMDDGDSGMLRRLERLEALSLGIDGKLALWHSLRAASALDAQLTGPDYEGLIQRARDQRESVEALRIEAATVALPTAA
jgi:uncharacterized tellurite resistance protein B-like protein